MGRLYGTAGKAVAKVKAAPAAKVQARSAKKELVGKTVAKAAVRSKADSLILAAPRVRMLTAEYLIAVILGMIALVYMDGTYTDKMRKFVIQMTGISAVFFVMSIAGVSEKAAKVAIMFGALIDLSILFHTVKVKKTQTPNAAEMTSEAEPFWTTDPNGVAAGNISNAIPGQGSTGSTQNATPAPSKPGTATATATTSPPKLSRTLVAV